MNDYERIARVIEHLDAHFIEQPDLETLAAQAGLSSSHFHRLFTSWAGVTPKDFLQCLTLNHAKAMLRSGESVLDAALSAGLSGPGRLHDLCISLEAATPGEVKSGGKGFVIRFGLAETPFGRWLVADNGRGICHVAFIDDDERTAISALHAQWWSAEFIHDDQVAEDLVGIVFSPQAQGTTLRAYVRGTDFQVRVWRALLEIPAGGLVSYGRLATFIGHARASRAVGTAVGQNALAYLIPCHRVIRDTGIVGQYRWGTVRKRAMIGWELMKRE